MKRNKELLKLKFQFQMKADKKYYQINLNFLKLFIKGIQ